MTFKRKFAIATFPLRDGLREIVIMRFGFLGKSSKVYHQAIQKSGWFNPDFYRAQRPRCWVARFMPLRHFILRGERMGLNPCEGFEIEAYLHANPDVRRRGVAPFRHFLEHGKSERRRLRVTRDTPVPIAGLKLPEIRKPATPSGRPIAVVVHLYYFDLWDEILRHLQNLTLPFDLLVTITDKVGAGQMVRAVKRDRPDAMVWVLPNHGRDIFPFVYLLNSGLLSSYRLVCKVHGKKSLHRKDGAAWRNHLTASILPPGGQAAELVRKILEDPEAGLVVADGQISSGEKFWGKNRKRCRELLAVLGIDIEGQPLRFPLGSIFWVTQPVLARLRELDLKPWQFEPEHSQLDGTLAHAVERTLGLIAVAGGLRVDECSDLLKRNPGGRAASGASTTPADDDSP